MWYIFMTANVIQTLQALTYPYSLYTKIYVSVNVCRSLFECFTPFVDRSLATIAELCFAKQLSTSLNSSFILDYALLSQIFCWGAMITHNNLFHIYQEYLWFLIGYHYYWYSNSPIRQYIAFIYCCYMIFIDIPMYLYRFINQDVPECTSSDWRIGYFIGASRISMYLN